MYIDPDLGGLLLEPLFRLQASPKYTNPYAAQDIGTNIPMFQSINNSPHDQGVEEREYVDHDLCSRSRKWK
ncbi:hypothetical protein EDB87DRAFT_1591261 [Lactarius vividus]|nr:hypothetical protein EDB87DRAFT_1591261 [Lactarius vividus]